MFHVKNEIFFIFQPEVFIEYTFMKIERQDINKVPSLKQFNIASNSVPFILKIYST